MPKCAARRIQGLCDDFSLWKCLMVTDILRAERQSKGPNTFYFSRIVPVYQGRHSFNTTVDIRRACRILNADGRDLGVEKGLSHLMARVL